MAAVLLACAGRSPGSPVPGSPSSSFEWDGLRLRIRLLASPADRVRARGTLINVADGHLAREVPRCVVMLRLYRDDRRVWSDGAGTGCFGRRVVRLEPGEFRGFHRSLRADRILGDSLPAGRYLVRAYWPGADRPGAVRTQIEVTLGEVTLDPDPGAGPDASARPPPPAGACPTPAVLGV